MGSRSRWRPQPELRTGPDVIVVLLGIGCAVVLLFVTLTALGVFSSDDTGSVVDTAALATASDGASAATDASPPTTVSCESTHSGHNVMRWNATMADEMVDAGCEWPYEPFTVPLTGGEEDPRLDDAPFEPRQYSEIWDALQQIDVGSCAVAALPDEPGEGGFVFGFDFGVAEPGCATNATAHVVASEFGTRAQRDAAANASEVPATYVLGRWVVTVTGEEAAMADALEEGVVSLGAVAVPD